MTVLHEKKIKEARRALTFGPFALPAGDTHIGVFVKAARWPAPGPELFRVSLVLFDGDAREEHTVVTDGPNPETPGEWHLVLDLGVVADAAHPGGRRRLLTHDRHLLSATITFARPLACSVRIATDTV